MAGPRMKRGKEGLTLEQKRAAVGEVMSHWQDYERFSDFFDALLKANDNMGAKELETALNKKTPHTYQHSELHKIRTGAGQPTYELITDLLKTNVLNLDPAHIREDDNNRPAGWQRIALFTKAELIEVTRNTIQEFNKDVMAGVERRLENGEVLHWSDIMAKLIAFHTQGGRDSVKGIQRQLNEEGKPGSLFPYDDSLPNILGKNAEASNIQRNALYQEVGLLPKYTEFLEKALQEGKVSTAILPPESSPFSDKLDFILRALNAKGISLKDVERAGGNDQDGKARISGSQLSLLRQGKGHGVTLSKLRAIVDVLESFKNAEVVTGGDINELIQRSGFTREQLNMTVRSVIRDADELNPDVHSLLSNIRNARDMEVTQAYISSDERMTDRKVSISHDQINQWESTPRLCPTAEQSRELMGRYSNELIARSSTTQSNGESHSAGLTDQEIEKVVRIAEKSKEAWNDLSNDQKIERKRDAINWRKRITPEIGNGKNGRA